MPKNPCPAHGLIPYLIVRSARDALAFYQRAFDAVLLYELPMPDGRLGHAELTLGSARRCSQTSFPRWTASAP